VGISKGGNPFCPPQNIDGMQSALFSELSEERWLAGLDLDPSLNRAAYHVCELNAIHPFREGTGRAIRFYIDVLSVRSRGDLFDWTQAGAEGYSQACIEGFNQDYRRLRLILMRCADQGE
jgi:cell filamentation protein